MDDETKEKLKSYIEKYGKLYKQYGEELIRRQTYDSISEICFYMSDRKGCIKNTDLYIKSTDNIKNIENDLEKLEKRIMEFIDSF